MKSLIIQSLFAVLLLPQLLWAQTFVVTSSSSCGSGSFNEAVQYANNTPGKDRIEFDPGLSEIGVLFCGPPPDQMDFFLAKATESVDIVGVDDLDPSTSAKERLLFKGYNVWISSSGHKNPDRCPNQPNSTDIVIAEAPGLLTVGNYGVDNSGIDVTLTNIDVDGLNTLAWVNKAASLNISNGSFTHMESGFRHCNINTIYLKEKASLSLYKTHFQDNKVMDSFGTGYYKWIGLIGALDATVEIQDSTFSYNQTGGLIYQFDGNLTIVNTKVDDSQGIGAFDTSVHIVNTGIWSNRIDSGSTHEGVHVNGGSISLDATTIYNMAWQHATPPYDLFGLTTNSVQFSATGNASVTFIDTAIGATWPSGSTLPFSYTTGASGVSVTRSWVRDGSLPGADATLPGLSDTASWQFEQITPIAGGALVDKSAATLLNPLTGAVITTDVLGNPRVIGSLRDIGAIELPPLYVADSSYSTVMNTPINKSVTNGLLAGSTPAGTLTVTAITTPAHGSVTAHSDGKFVYTPSTGYYGTDAFSFTATDPASQSEDGDVTITVAPPAGTPPTAANDAYMDTIPTTCITVAAPGVLSNDTDPLNTLPTPPNPPKQPNDGLTARKVTDPANASLTFNGDGSFSLCPDDPSLVWEYSFTYDVITTDSRVSSPATVTVQHRLNANKPIATQDSYTQTGGTTWTIATLGVLTNDVDPNNQFQKPPALPNQDMVSVLVTGVSHGTLQLNTDGSFEYTPKNGFSGTDSFTYKAVASKGLGQESNPTTVTLTVQAGPTQLPGKPVLSITTVGSTSAGLSWTTPSPGTSPITGYLVHYRQTAMTIWVNWPHTGTATTTTITGLTSGKAYAFQVAAVSAVGSGAFSNTASTKNAPTVTTQSVSGIGTTSADGNGNITDLGAPNPTQHGVCWNTTGTPTIGDSKTEEGAASATGAFTSNMTGLSAYTTYYARAYATNTAGTSYGNEVSFTTRAQAPTVTTQSVTGIGKTSADGNGNITDLGSPNPTQHGVCWNTTGTPTIAGSKTEEGPVSATGPFTSHMTGLSPNTTYYVRAYATDVVGTIYGNQVSFTTGGQGPTVTTEAVSAINKTTATGNGNITDLGISNVTQHGVCWNTTGNPTTADSKTKEGPASATGAFTSNMTGLHPGTDYYVRAYATNASGTSYGSQVFFISSGRLATGTPFSYKVTVTKVEMYNGTSWVTIFSGTAQLDMVPGGTFPGISGLSLPAGTYSQVRITFNNAFPVTGTLSHDGTAYYTTVTDFGGKPHLFSTSTTVAGSMSGFEFYEPAWGALNADVIQTSSITPITVGPSTDYQPTLRFTISTTFHLKESTGNTPSVYFTLGVPPVSLVAP